MLSELKEFVISKHRGFGAIAGAVNGFTAVAAGALLLMVILYVAITLNTSLNSNKVGEVLDDVLVAITNFTTQLGTVGTIAGVALILAVIGGGLLWARGRVGGSGM